MRLESAHFVRYAKFVNNARRDSADFARLDFVIYDSASLDSAKFANMANLAESARKFYASVYFVRL